MLCLIDLDVWGRYCESMVHKIYVSYINDIPLKLKSFYSHLPTLSWGIFNQRPVLLGFHFQLQHTTTTTTTTTIPPHSWTPKNKNFHWHTHTPTHVHTHTHTHTDTDYPRKDYRRGHCQFPSYCVRLGLLWCFEG